MGYLSVRLYPTGTASSFEFSVVIGSKFTLRLDHQPQADWEATPPAYFLGSITGTDFSMGAGLRPEVRAAPDIGMDAIERDINSLL